MIPSLPRPPHPISNDRSYWFNLPSVSWVITSSSLLCYSLVQAFTFQIKAVTSLLLFSLPHPLHTFLSVLFLELFMSFTCLIIHGWFCHLHDKAWTISITFKILNKLTPTQVFHFYLAFFDRPHSGNSIQSSHSMNVPVTRVLHPWKCEPLLSGMPRPLTRILKCSLPFKTRLKCKLLLWNLFWGNKTKWLNHWLWELVGTVLILTLLLFRYITLVKLLNFSVPQFPHL